MGVKIASLHLPQTIASLFSSPSLKRRSFSFESALFGTVLHRSSSSSNLSTQRCTPLRRASSAGMDSSAFFDDEFAKQLQELATKFQIDDDPLENDTIFDDTERKLNSVEIPLSLRMIKRKKRLQKDLRAAGESASSSVKKAFSNMVFIIRELQCFTIQMRETILCEDLQGILSRVQTEIHASFVWLFQQVFSHTPTLMVYIMILLANYSVYSMSALAAPQPPPPATESASILEHQNTKQFHPSPVRDFIGRTASVGGGGRGGENFRPVSSGTDGGGNFRTERVIVPDDSREEESVSGEVMREEEVRLWDSIVDEAMKMQFEFRGKEVLDRETLRRFVSPVLAKIDNDDYDDYFQTELFYQMGLAQDPANTLLLANYAQFLYLVAHDYDRAEEFFKRAVKVDSPDAEALSKYASFLWQAKKDLWAAEETYLDAISADPTNSYYAANYAHFLWNTGGEETCYPIDAPDEDA